MLQKFLRTTHWWEYLLLMAALSLFALQDLAASPLKSAAFDEQYHLAAGYSYLRTGDPRLATNHPPLMGMLGGLALLGQTVNLPLDHQAWATGDRYLFSDIFLWEANPNAPALFVAARRPIIAVGILLLVGLFFFARGLLGWQASWLVLLLATFDPNLLANARLVTTDLGLACLLLLGLWRLWCWLEQRSWLNLVLVGICAGFAMTAKYTGLFFWPSAFLVTCIYPAMSKGDRIWRRWLGLIGMGFVAYLVIWAVYGFTFGLFQSEFFQLTLPASFYWQQLYNTYFHIVDAQGEHYDFLLGEASNKGWWYYFPVALAVKTPLPLLLLFFSGLGVVARRGLWRRTSVLWVLPLLFLGICLTGILTIGYRHILPAIPCMIMLAGYTLTLPVTPPQPSPSGGLGWGYGRRWGRGKWLSSTLIAFCLLWLVIDSVRIWPHQEAFFNELAGDWYNWSNILVDSNLDWGQDLPALQTVMDKMGIAEVNLAYFGKAVPEAYGVRYRPLPSYLRFIDGIELNAYNPYQPEPGWYAISATALRLGLLEASNVNLYAYFRDKHPVARAGYSIYLYHITYPDSLPIKRAAVFGQPVAQLPAAQLGIQPDQRVQVKWAKSPETALYPLGQGFAPPTDSTYHSVNANYADVFTLLGYTQPSTVKPGKSAHLTLYWQVGPKAMPMPAPTKGAPLSAFIHVVDGDPAKRIAQYDGWETALRGLELGDVIVQQADIEIGEQVQPGGYTILIGLYSPQNGARLTVNMPQGPVDAMEVGQLQVKR